MKKSTGSVLQEKACCFEQFQSSDMDNLIKIFVDTLDNVWHFHYNQNVEDFDTCMYILIIYVFWKFNEILI